jgi:hypothetical protein
MQCLTPSWRSEALGTLNAAEWARFPRVHSHLQPETRMERLRDATTVAVGRWVALIRLAACRS